MTTIKNTIYKFVANHLLRQTPMAANWGDEEDERSTEEIVNQKIRIGLYQWVSDKRYRDNNVNIDEIAHTLHVASAQLSHFFRTQMGTRFTTWRKQLRITEAKELLLKRPELSITEVGLMVGFEDKSNFRKAFKDICHCTPGEWRERQI